MDSCSCADSRPIAVLLVDDHEAVLAGLAALIHSHAPKLRLAGVAQDGRTAFDVAQRSAVDVVVLDVALGDEDGLSLLPGLRAATGAETVVLTWSDDPATCARALSLGASSLISKSAPGAELVAAIHAAARPRGHMTKATWWP